jgi:hypothetical protein
MQICTVKEIYSFEDSRRQREPNSSQSVCVSERERERERERGGMNTIRIVPKY